MLDHVVEDLRRGEEQPPVEAHRAVRGAAGPAGALTANLQARGRSAPARATARVEALGDLLAGLAAIPALQGVLDRLPARGAHAHLQRPAAPRHVGPHPPGLHRAPAGRAARRGRAPRRRPPGVPAGARTPPRPCAAGSARSTAASPPRRARPRAGPGGGAPPPPPPPRTPGCGPGGRGRSGGSGRGWTSCPDDTVRGGPVKRKKPIPRVLIIAFAVGILALALTLARDSETEGKDTGPQVEVSPVSGSSRSSPAASEAILRVPALEPGGKTSASVRVRNSGDAPGLFLLSLGDGPPPAEGLELTVADVTGRGSQRNGLHGRHPGAGNPAAGRPGPRLLTDVPAHRHGERGPDPEHGDAALEGDRGPLFGPPLQASAHPGRPPRPGCAWSSSPSSR